MLFSASFIQVSNGHCMTLDYSSDFPKWWMQLTWWVTSLIWRLEDHSCSLRWEDNTCCTWSSWRSTRRLISTASIRSQLSLRISTNTIYFKFSKEEYVFIVLLQNYFEHVWVKILFFFCIVLISNNIILHNFYCIERDCRYRSS